VREKRRKPYFLAIEVNLNGKYKNLEFKEK